jgi:hypothetical protein
LRAVSATVQQIAERFGVSDGDVRALIAQYPGDVPLWEDAVVLTPEVGYDLSRMLSPHGERTIQR